MTFSKLKNLQSPKLNPAALVRGQKTSAPVSAGTGAAPFIAHLQAESRPNAPAATPAQNFRAFQIQTISVAANSLIIPPHTQPVKTLLTNPKRNLAEPQATQRETGVINALKLGAEPSLENFTPPPASLGNLNIPIQSTFSPGESIEITLGHSQGELQSSGTGLPLPVHNKILESILSPNYQLSNGEVRQSMSAQVTPENPNSRSAQISNSISGFDLIKPESGLTEVVNVPHVASNFLGEGRITNSFVPLGLALSSAENHPEQEAYSTVVRAFKSLQAEVQVEGSNSATPRNENSSVAGESNSFSPTPDSGDYFESEDELSTLNENGEPQSILNSKATSESSEAESELAEGEFSESAPSARESHSEVTSSRGGDLGSEGQASRSSQGSVKLESPRGGATGSAGLPFYVVARKSRQMGKPSPRQNSAAAPLRPPTHPAANSLRLSRQHSSSPGMPEGVQSARQWQPSLKTTNESSPRPSTPEQLEKLHQIVEVRELAERLQARARLGATETRQLELRLKPPYLGSVRVLIETLGEEMRLVLVTDRPEAAGALNEAAPELSRLIAEQGYHLTQCDIQNQSTPQNRWQDGYAASQAANRRQDANNAEPEPESENVAEEDTAERQPLYLGYNSFDLVA